MYDGRGTDADADADAGGVAGATASAAACVGASTFAAARTLLHSTPFHSIPVTSNAEQRVGGQQVMQVSCSGSVRSAQPSTTALLLTALAADEHSSTHLQLHH